MRNLIIATLVVAVAISLTWWATRYNPSPPKYNDPPIKVEDMTEQDVLRMKAINDSYDNLKSLSADAEIMFKKGKVHRLTATIQCRNPREYRLIIKSYLSDEADVGCNTHHYWYWFKRNNELMYDVYEKAKFSDVPLNPVWLSECFKTTPFDIKGKIVRKDDYTALVSKRGSCISVTVFDKDMTKVKGYYLYDAQDQLAASCDVLKTVIVDGYELPSLLNLSCPKENINMEWRIANYKVNVSQDDKVFSIPPKPIMKLIR